MLYKYFIEPILKNGWFNPVNTGVYSILLVLAVFLVFRMVKKMKIRVDDNFIISLVPFIFWASLTRVIHDAAFAGNLSHLPKSLQNFFSLPIFVTPGSYLITFLLSLFFLSFSLLLQRFKGIKYYKTMFVSGNVLCIVDLFLIPFKSYVPMTHFILPVTFLWFLILLFMRDIAERSGFEGAKKFFSWKNISIIESHMLDATATWTALAFFGYVEQHVVPRAAIYFFGPSVMFLLKVIVIFPVLWLIEKDVENEEFKNFIKLAILILGLAPGVRDAVRLMAMV